MKELKTYSWEDVTNQVYFVLGKRDRHGMDVLYSLLKAIQKYRQNFRGKHATRHEIESVLNFSNTPRSGIVSFDHRVIRFVKDLVRKNVFNKKKR